jgi:predicted phosphodiesterase
MESFAPLYPNEFLIEIEMMKNFQDILGEIHDCDVWIERIPKFISDLETENSMFPEKQQASTEGNQGLPKFLTFIKEKRKNQYEKFVSLWDIEKNKNSFEELRTNASAGFVAARYRTQAELANPYVKIAVLADINGNLDALEAVIQDAERLGVTVFLNAGDMLGFGAFPNEVIRTLYSKNALSVIGDYDFEILDEKNIGKEPKKFALEYTRRTLAKSYETYLRMLPSKLELEIAHKKLLVIDSVNQNQGNMPEEKLHEYAKNVKADIIVFDKSVEQYTKKIGEVLFINPGSVGKSEDGHPQASYAAITANPFSVELLRVNYDVETAADALRKKGAPEAYAQSLLRGLSLEDVIGEDKAKENDMETKCALMTRNCRKVAKKYCPDMRHSEHVGKLSLELFDALQTLHKLGARERCWLDCAAVLHEIGLSQGSNAHHKNTLKLILNDTHLPFTSVERRVIGNVARYHRKGCPKAGHYNFMSLSRELRRKVTIIASILRLADGLDFSHQSVVQRVEANVNLDNVNVCGVVFLNPILEEQGFNKKKDLFEKTFKKKTVFTWKLQPKAADNLTQSTISETVAPDLAGAQTASLNPRSPKAP